MTHLNLKFHRPDLETFCLHFKHRTTDKIPHSTNVFQENHERHANPPCYTLFFLLHERENRNETKTMTEEMLIVAGLLQIEVQRF